MHLESLQGAAWLALFHWFSDRGVERRPVVQWLDAQELDQRVNLLDPVLPDKI